MGNKETEKKTIKEIAGDVLLYFYAKQRENIYTLEASLLDFDAQNSDIQLIGEGEFENSIRSLAVNSGNDVLNGIDYLLGKDFINCTKKSDNRGWLIHNITLTSTGVDIVEGIERGKSERNNFYMTFNIKLTDTINVESLLKAELGSIFKLI